MKTDKKILDAKDIAKLYNISTEDARTLMASKQFPVLQVGNKLIVLATELEKWANDGEEKPVTSKEENTLRFEVLKIGHNLRKLRENAGLGTRDLGQLFGVSGSAVSHWETGDCNVSLVYLKKYHELFNVDYNTLLKEKDDENKS